MTFDNLLFSLVWDDLPQRYSRWTFEFVSRFSPILYAPVTIENHWKFWCLICTWMLTWKLRIKALLDAQMHATVHALEYVALAGSSKTVPQCTPGSGPEAGQRAGSGKVISRLAKHPRPARSPDLSPLDLVLERGHDRVQKWYSADPSLCFVCWN